MNLRKRFESELNVRSESVQRIYNYYLADRFIVNRRYQRKLVWSVDEKKRLIDSAVQQLPIPLILVAETLTEEASTTFELIDGLQRINAIVAFIENEYPIEGGYFDLSTLADTKALLDANELAQKQPVLPRDTSAALANYTFAFSVFRSATEDSVDEVFRRINSSGRKLSNHDLRQAGTTSQLANLVRNVSSHIRSDSSPTDQVPLSAMPGMSISSNSLKYGIDVDDIYWVKDGILNREDVRSSLDEELVLDILIDMVAEPWPNTGTKTRNAYFNFTRSDSDEPTRQSKSIESTIRIKGEDAIVVSFENTFDELRRIVGKSGQRFCDLIGIGSRNSIPRYYHCAYVALHQLLEEGLEVADYDDAARRLKDKHKQFHIQKGGEWSAEQKQQSVDVVKGLLRGALQKKADVGRDASVSRASFLERLLANSRVEHQMFEMKQGFLDLSDDRPSSVPDAMIEKIARTASAIANFGPKHRGYIVIGVADGDRDAARIQALDGIDGVKYRGFSIVGIDREARHAGVEVREYWDRFTRKLSTHTAMDKSLAQRIGSTVTLVPYGDLAVGVIEIEGGSTPVFYDGEIYERRGSETLTVEKTEYARVYSRFLAPVQ